MLVIILPIILPHSLQSIEFIACGCLVLTSGQALDNAKR